MKDEQITQLSILGVVSIVGLIAAIGLLSTPSTNTAIPGVGGGQQDTVVGNAGFWNFGNTKPEDVIDDESPSVSQNDERDTNSRFTGSTGQRNPLQILSTNVESVIQETQEIIPRIPRSQDVQTYGLSQNPSANALNQLINMGGSPVCREAISLYNEMNSPEAILGATVEDARALDMTTKILEYAMSEGDCWLELYHNKLGGSDFAPVPQNNEQLSIEQEYTSNVQTAITALQTNSDVREALSGQEHSIASLRGIVRLHKGAKQTNTFVAQEISGINLLNSIRQVARSEDRSMIIGLSETQGDRVTGPTPERLGVNVAWRVWNDEEMKRKYQEIYDETSSSLIGGLLNGITGDKETSDVTWKTGITDRGEMRDNYPRSPTLSEEDTELLVELTKRGFDPGRVLERKWSVVSGDNSDTASGALDENNETIWLRSTEGEVRAYKRGRGQPTAATTTLEEELIHFFHFQLGPDRTSQIINQVWSNSPGADSVADRDDYSSEIDHRHEYELKPHERLAKGLKGHLTADLVRTGVEYGRISTEGELNSSITSALVDAYFEDKTPYSPSVESLIIEEIRENQRSQTETETTASLDQNSGSGGNDFGEFFG